jgi:hypothetical protein
MKKISFLLIFVALLGNISQLRAQILNGDFSSGLDNWTSLGNPTSGSVGISPPSGTTEAVIQSTDSTVDPSDAVSVSTIEGTLLVTLPSTSGTPPPSSLVPPGTFSPTNGEAIYQEFTLTTESVLSFAYSYQTNDYSPFDSVGYTLGTTGSAATYTQLVATPAYSGPGETPQTDYTTLTLTLGPGEYTLGFVAYNTRDEEGSSTLYIANAQTTVPEPKEYVLIILGISFLIFARKWRPKIS